MYYYQLNMSNGHSSCYEIYLLKTETELTNEDFNGYLEGNYTYSDGFWGFDDDWELKWDSYDDFFDNYIKSILDNSCYIEVDKNTFDKLVDCGYQIIKSYYE